MQGARFELANPYGTGPSSPIEVSETELKNYLSLREVAGLSKSWIKRIKGWLIEYLNYTGWKVEQTKTLEFLKAKKEEYMVETYRKMLFQVRKFLDYLNVEWAKKIKAPPEPEYRPKRVTREDILKTLEYFKKHPYFIQIRALILLGASSGLRAEELYQLEPEDIDLENRIIYVRHEPEKGKTTKTGKSRIAFFNEGAKQALIEYLGFFNNGCNLRYLFGRTHLERAFKNAPIKVKDLRKFFSQEWDRRGGATSIKKILMGHSLRGDVDLNHYNAQSEEDLKRIYDKIFDKIFNDTT
ncbi:MAG: site-specific integrase [Thermoplasmata archaeon]|nr:site-specific integrase [Thermoplasmata archaeon]